MRRAVFLDRDGTITEEVGYLRDVDGLRILPGVASAIARLNRAGIQVIVITNQSGVARGYFSEGFIEEVHQKMKSILAMDGASIDGHYYCPHHPEGTVERYRHNCKCRKPEIGMLEQAAREHDLDLPLSFVVGDKYLDVQTGFRAGARSILVLTGYGRELYAAQGRTWPRQPDHVAEDLAQAVDWILEQSMKQQHQAVPGGEQ